MSEKLQETEAEQRARFDAQMTEECLAAVADRLKAHGCKCGPTAHEGTPPMFYPEWINCVVHTAVMKERERSAGVAAATFPGERVEMEATMPLSTWVCEAQKRAAGVIAAAIRKGAP